MQGFARKQCEMQPKHVLNETDASRRSKQPRQTAGSISMELVSLWDRDRVLYSMASHWCFQQTVHHYSIWQDSKHCALTWVKKKVAPLHLFLLSPFTASSCCFVFPLFLASLWMFVVFPSLYSFLFCHQQHCRVHVYLTQTFRKIQLYIRFLFA